MTKIGFNLGKLYVGALKSLRTDSAYFSTLTKHKPELGRLNETHLVRLIRSQLPPKIGVGTGFIACGGNTVRQSRQCDIVLYDALSNAPLFSSPAWSIFPIEMVYGVIEVKTRLTPTTLKDAFHHCATVRAMAETSNGKASTPNKAYVRQIPNAKNHSAQFVRFRASLPPRFFIFAYQGWASMRLLERNFVAASEGQPNAHIHGLCNVSEGCSMWIQHRAFQTGSERFANIPSNGLAHFLMTLPHSLNSMLPLERLGLGFDQVDLNHYHVEMDYEAMER